MLLLRSRWREVSPALLAAPASSTLLSRGPEELKAWLSSFRPPVCFKQLKHIHARLLRLCLDQDSYLLNLLLRSLFESGKPDHANHLFAEVREPNIYLWNTMIRGFVAADRWEEAAYFYCLMRREGLCPNNFTFPFVLKACARLLDLELGLKVHAHILKAGFELDVFVKTSLVCMYAKCGRLDESQEMFDEMPVKNVVSWTAIITGYMEGGRLEDALGLFRKMLEMDLKPDSFTLVRVLTACSQLGDLKTGEWIDRYIEEKVLDCNVFVATSLVDLYAKCGRMDKARQIFDGMTERDVVSWSAMVAGYSSNGLPREALEIFYRMQEQRVKPDCFTIVGVLSACGRLGALEFGHSVGSLIDRDVYLCNPVLGTALIDMYAKCGSVGRAWAVFEAMKQRDVVAWNAMISGLAMNGFVKVSFSLFAHIEKLGFVPDGNTFVGLLCSCTHSGLVEDGRRYFDSMSRVYGLTPKVEHYGCIVDLLGRTGLLDEAYQLIKEMPVEANAVVWGALLSGCRIYRDIWLAERVLKRLIELEPQNSGNYVLLSNIYANSSRWGDAAKLRLVMKHRGIEKIPGCSWVEVNGVVHEFRVGDRSHPLHAQIYSKLEELGKQLKALGYTPTTEVVMFDVEEEEKEHSLGHHSEKLAVAFGLITIPAKDVIRVVKNLRVCGDCHTAIKLISKVSDREIVVRDNNRFHCFKDGSCSCKDFW